MKFDFCIGNPPYQDETIGDNDSFAPPVYDKFLDAARTIADKVEMIHPARFLFNAGATSKAWNRKMLEDEHFKILEYKDKSNAVFPQTSITGGLAISYYDKEKQFDAIEVFTSYSELNSILNKVKKRNDFVSLLDYIYVQNRFNLEVLFCEYPHLKKYIGSDGTDRRIRNNSIDKIKLFSDVRRNSDDVAIYAVSNNKRKFVYFPSRFFDMNHENFKKWKVLVSVANGAAGTIGDKSARIIGNPIIEKPYVGYTQSFIGIGAFSCKTEAEACCKYVKSKFLRCMLGILKVTQNGSRDTWKYVPLQDFTAKSDIDWTKSVHEIDLQLYKKYGLSDNEVKFIEEKIKELE